MHLQYGLKFVIMLLIGAFLSSCIHTKKEALHYYLIDATNALVSDNNTPLNLNIRELHIPQYLDRFQIVTRAMESRLKLAEFHLWGENLRTNLIQTVVTYISRALNPTTLTSPLEYQKTKSDYDIDIVIEQFELAADNHVKLEFHWRIIDVSTMQIVDSQYDRYTSTHAINANDYDAIVLTMQRLFNQLCQQLVERLWLLV